MTSHALSAPSAPLHERATLTVIDEVAELRLTRPEAGNAIDPGMVAAIDDTVRAAAAAIEAGEVRAVLLVADGRSFCVGGDLRHFDATMDDLPGQFREMIGTWHGSTLPRSPRSRCRWSPPSRAERPEAAWAWCGAPTS
jgi:Enoyl-CoA hydratase/carnithine racemase